MRRLVVWLGSGDHWLFYYINRRLSCRPLDWLMPKLTALGGATVSVALCVLLWLWGVGATKVAAAEAMTALTGSHALARVMKRVAARRRPYLVLPEVRTISSLWTDHSFPSGHTAAAFSLAAGFALNFPPLALSLVSVAGLIGISRMYLGQHYPTDVLFGAFLGTVSAAWVHYLTIFSYV
ncbi:hypothetical protein SY88_12800 [Clostridiales bacterium PH28_bin88]|nr:hypothetical protein SY88_12800 [Clostridiales bacterium PH28_bin88]